MKPRQAFNTVLAAVAVGALLVFAPVALAAPGDVDAGFSAPTFDGPVAALAVQDDDKVIVGGFFTTAGGDPVSRVVRLNGDGSIDNTFQGRSFNLPVRALKLQADGKVLVGGEFTSVDGNTSQRYLVRLTETGALDAEFGSSLPDGPVHSIDLASGGKIVIGGAFSSVSLGPNSKVARLNANGTVDGTFAAPVIAGDVEAIAVLPDQRVVIGGDFASVGGAAGTAFAARLESGGARDASFSPDLDGPVLSVALASGGRTLVGGFFEFVGGDDHGHLAGLNATGGLDEGFSGPRPNDAVHAIAVQGDGSVVVGGRFTQVGGDSRNRIARFSASGTLDTGFVPPVFSGAAEFSGPRVDALALANAGRIVTGGRFSAPGAFLTRLDGQTIAAAPSVDPASGLAFGSIPQGASSEMLIVELTATAGPGSLQIPADAISLTGPNAGNFNVVTETCSTGAITPGNSCAIAVVFTPGALGLALASLVVDGNTASPVSIPLTGTGVTPPKIATSLKLSPAKVKPGKTGTVAVTVRNTGQGTASTIKVCPTLKGAPKKALKILGGSKGCKTVATLAAGASKVVKLKVQAHKKKAKSGKSYNLTVVTTARNAHTSGNLPTLRKNLKFRVK